MNVQKVPAFFDTTGPEERFLISPRFGWTLRLGSWQLSEPTHGRVVILPGRGDFLEKYAHIARFLNAHGYSVYALDWPGQGGSGRLGRHPQAGHIRSYDDYGVVFGEFLDAYGLRGGPVFWLAYSMGGAVAMKELLKGRWDVRGAVLISPMFGFEEALPEAFIELLAHGAHQLGLGRRFALGEGPTDVATWDFAKSRAISGEEAFGAVKTFLFKYPQFVLGGSSRGWVRASLEAFGALRRADRSGIPTPVLLVSAREETTVSLGAQAEIAKRLPNAAFVTLPGKHDLLLNSSGELERLLTRIADFVSRVGSRRHRRFTFAHGVADCSACKRVQPAR